MQENSNVMIDIETLGTNHDSQVLSIGACMFDGTGKILDTFYRVIQLDPNKHVNATPSTMQFWIGQGSEAFNDLLNNENAVSMCGALSDMSSWLSVYDKYLNVWANGTKFDIGMLEKLFKDNDIDVPWAHNADRCMRTIRQFAERINIDFEGRAHHALDDAIWQAKYTAEACKVLGLKL